MPKKEVNRVANREFHYTYLITDTINNKYYYGVHSTDYEPTDITQYHSSSKHLKLLIRELGIDNFTKQVRRYFNTRRDADVWEHKVLRRMKVRTRLDFYNQAEGGEGFAATGYVVVRCKTTGKTLRVPCEDPYIGILYDYLATGTKLSEEQRVALSELYKDKWKGGDNPVYHNRHKSSWRESISKANSGKKLPEHQVENLRDPSHWKHLMDYSSKEETISRMNFQRSINNNKYANIYLFKGDVYLHKGDLPVDIKHTEAEIVPQPHPLVNLLRAGDSYYPDIKTAAKSIGVHKNTVSNRIKNPHECWKDYYFLDEDEVKEEKRLSEVVFKNRMHREYSNRLEEQKLYVRPFSLGMSDQEATELFMSTGKFLKGVTFKRSDEKDSHGTFSWYNVTCPVCSNDKYAESNICTGTFKAKYGRLKSGYPPCRCGDSKNFKIPVYLYHVRDMCEKEGIELLGIAPYKGKKETKLIWKCRKGAVHENTRLGLFLENGNRCVCCKDYYKDNPPEIVNLTILFKERFEDFKKENS